MNPQSGAMGLRILVIGDDLNHLKVDGEMLRSKGFRVYYCLNKDLVNEMLEETSPDIAFINSSTHTEDSADIYHSLLDNLQYVTLPVVYTLSEDDVYLVNRKRTAIKEQRYMTTNNVLDAIRMAFLHSGEPATRKRIPVLYPIHNNNIYSPFRA